MFGWRGWARASFPNPIIPSAVGSASARAFPSCALDLRLRPRPVRRPKLGTYEPRASDSGAPLSTGQVNYFGQVRKKERDELFFPEREGR